MIRPRTLILWGSAAVLGAWVCVVLITPQASRSQARQAVAGSYDGPPRDIKTLAPIIQKTCSQCHLAPPPNVLPKRAWPDILNQMLDFANRDLLKRFDRPITEVRFDELVFSALMSDSLTICVSPAVPSAQADSGISTQLSKKDKLEFIV